MPATTGLASKIGSRSETTNERQLSSVGSSTMIGAGSFTT